MDVQAEREVDHHEVDGNGSEAEALVLHEQLMGDAALGNEQADRLPDDAADQYTEKEGQGQQANAPACQVMTSRPSLVVGCSRFRNRAGPMGPRGRYRSSFPRAVNGRP